MLDGPVQPPKLKRNAPALHDLPASFRHRITPLPLNITSEVDEANLREEDRPIPTIRNGEL
jgi:hypothetical protein